MNHKPASLGEIAFGIVMMVTVILACGWLTPLAAKPVNELAPALADIISHREPEFFKKLPAGCTFIIHRTDAPTTNVTNLGPTGFKMVEIRTNDIVGPKDATYSLWKYSDTVPMFGYKFRVVKGDVFVHSAHGLLNPKDSVHCP